MPKTRSDGVGDGSQFVSSLGPDWEAQVGQAGRVHALDKKGMPSAGKASQPAPQPVRKTSFRSARRGLDSLRKAVPLETSTEAATASDPTAYSDGSADPPWPKRNSLDGLETCSPTKYWHASELRQSATQRSRDSVPEPQPAALVNPVLPFASRGKDASNRQKAPDASSHKVAHGKTSGSRPGAIRPPMEGFSIVGQVLTNPHSTATETDARRPPPERAQSPANFQGVTASTLAAWLRYRAESPIFNAPAAPPPSPYPAPLPSVAPPPRGVQTAEAAARDAGGDPGREEPGGWSARDPSDGRLPRSAASSRDVGAWRIDDGGAAGRRFDDGGAAGSVTRQEGEETRPADMEGDERGYEPQGAVQGDSAEEVITERSHRGSAGRDWGEGGASDGLDGGDASRDAGPQVGYEEDGGYGGGSKSEGEALGEKDEEEVSVKRQGSGVETSRGEPLPRRAKLERPPPMERPPSVERPVAGLLERADSARSSRAKRMHKLRTQVHAKEAAMLASLPRQRPCPPTGCQLKGPCPCVYMKGCVTPLSSANEGESATPPGLGTVTSAGERPTRGSLIFDSNFEGGNLGSVKMVSEFEYQLYLRPDTNAPKYRLWFHFTVRNCRAKQQALFSVVNFSKSGSLYRVGMSPVVRSTSRPKWERVPPKNVWYYKNSAFTRGYILSFFFTFDNPDDVYSFAYSFPFTYSMLQQILYSIDHRNFPYVRREVLGWTTQRRSIDCITITHPDNTSDAKLEARGGRRKVIFVCARVHPGETPASFVIHGMMTFLLSSHPDAEALRQECCFVLIPMLNPDGVFLGNYRTCSLGTDLNRLWTHPSEMLEPSIFYAKRKVYSLLADPLNDVDFFIDIHAHSTARSAFLFCNLPRNGRTAEESRVFPRLFDASARDFSMENCRFCWDARKAGTGRRVIGDNVDHIQCFTFEVSFFNQVEKVVEKERPSTDGPASGPPASSLPNSEESYMEIGQQLAYAFHAYYGLTKYVTQAEGATPTSGRKNSRSQGAHHSSPPMPELTIMDLPEVPPGRLQRPGQ
eukprot:jgi/Mesvir1/28978/Mv17751-RA.1